MLIILRPIKRDNWSGQYKYRNCYEDIKSYLTRSGSLYTGLTKDEAKRLGEELGYDLGPNSEFWANFFIRTFGKDLYLNLEDPLDELKHLFLKSHKRVKNSLLERKATANFVLINKGEEAKRTNVINRIRREAMREFDNMNIEDIRKCLRLFGHNADKLSNEVAENRMFEIVEGDPQSFLKRWVHNESRETEALLQRAISRNIIRRNKNIYKYGSETIGHSVIETVDFIDEPKNQDIKIAIIKQLEGKEVISDIKVSGLGDILEEEVKAFEKKDLSKAKISTDFDDEEVKKSKPATSIINKEDTI